MKLFPTKDTLRLRHFLDGFKAIETVHPELPDLHYTYGEVTLEGGQITVPAIIFTNAEESRIATVAYLQHLDVWFVQREYNYGTKIDTDYLTVGKNNKDICLYVTMFVTTGKVDTHILGNNMVLYDDPNVTNYGKQVAVVVANAVKNFRQISPIHRQMLNKLLKADIDGGHFQNYYLCKSLCATQPVTFVVSSLTGIRYWLVTGALPVEACKEFLYTFEIHPVVKADKQTAKAA